MNKYYTMKNYANKENVNETTILRQLNGNKLKGVKLTSSLPSLIYDKINDEPIVISLIQMKGGVGKSYIAANIGALLSKPPLNFRVLLVDTDHQNQIRLFFPKMQHDNTLKDALSGKLDIEKCIFTNETLDSKIDIIYSDFGLSLLAPEIKDKDILSKLLEKVKHNYDFIVMDTSPNIDILTINVARCSSHILIPVVPQAQVIDGLSHVFLAIEKVAGVSLNHIGGIIANMCNLKLVQQRTYMELLQKNYAKQIFDTVIPVYADIPKLADFRTNIFDFKNKSKASQALKKILWELLQRL